MDTLNNKAEMLSKLGSFWYRSLQDDAKTTAMKLTHMPFLNRCYKQFANIGDIVLNANTISDHYKVIRFKDKDIYSFGLDAYLQKRYGIKHGGKSRAEIPFKVGSFLASTDTEDILANRVLERIMPILFPDNNNLVDAEAMPLLFLLQVPKDTLVLTIETKSGNMLVNNVHYIASYGEILFFQNPISLFPNMKFMAQSYLKRQRNLYSYPLCVEDVYGDVSYIQNYYKFSQSPAAFRLALLQSCGLPVIKRDSIIVEVTPMLNGYSYLMQNGDRYDADFVHSKLNTGTTLLKDSVIGTDILDVVLPESLTPTSLSKVSLDGVISIDGLWAPNEVISIKDFGNYFSPALIGEQDKVMEFARQNSTKPDTGGKIPDSGNIVDYIRSTILENKSIIVMWNPNLISSKMKLNAQIFADREHPVGSVLMYGEMK